MERSSYRNLSCIFSSSSAQDDKRRNFRALLSQYLRHQVIEVTYVRQSLQVRAELQPSQKTTQHQRCLYWNIVVICLCCAGNPFPTTAWLTTKHPSTNNGSSRQNKGYSAIGSTTWLWFQHWFLQCWYSSFSGPLEWSPTVRQNPSGYKINSPSRRQRWLFPVGNIIGALLQILCIWTRMVGRCHHNARRCNNI